MGIKALKNHVDIMKRLYVKYGHDVKGQTDYVTALALVSIAESLAELVTHVREANDNADR